MKHDPAAGASVANVTHRSLERGLAALEMIAAATGPMTLADAARRLGLHRSTAHHLLRTLVALGYLRQDGTTRGYALTPKLHRMTGQKWSVEQLGEIAQPILETLTAETDEGTSVAAWMDGVVTIAAKREADGPVRVVQNVGAERPIYCTAVGKAIAAWLPDAEIRAVLARTTMVAHTAKTITTREAFEAELRRIRTAGYAIDDAEQHEGLRCIAMPVFCYSGQVIGSMCVVGPRHRMTHQKLQAVRGPLQRCSRQLSERLGYAQDTGATP
ncbi:IclR family transcriptional regulator [Bordetella genomosp. 9]|nr:IclR family transcriptional regulator [Bordetella genomosp. 9]